MTGGAGAEAAAAAVRAAAHAALGRGVELAQPPQVSAHDGWGAYRCALAGGDAGPWGRALVVRVAGIRRAGAATLAHEVAWHRLATAHGLGVPAVLAEVPDEPGPAALVVTGEPEPSLLECLGDPRLGVPVLAGLMGELHARLHALPLDGAPPVVGSDPFEDLAELLVVSGIAGGHFSAELDNLRRRQQGGGPLVVCHRRFQLSAVRLDPADPAGTAVVANWSAAGPAEREYDVAHTLLAFWSLPYLATGRARRRALRAVRDGLIAGYRSAYESHAALDDARLRYWEAFHALSWSARMAAGDGTPASSPWDPTGAITFRDSYRKDLTRRFVGLTRGER